MCKSVIAILLLSVSPFLSFSQSWEPATPPPDFLTDHSYGFAIDDIGYLVAGTTEFEGPTDAFLQYDPGTDSWTVLDSFPGAARGYGIGDVWDRKAYFGFGVSVDSILKDLWVFDPDSMRWSQLTSCPCEPRLHPAFVANNGKIFVGLGNNSTGNLNDWWEYDISTDQWSQKPAFPDTPRHHPYQFAVGDYVYTGLGHGNGIFREWYRYDPALEEWLRMADIPGEGRVAGAQFSYEGIGFVLSGDGDDHSSMETGEFWSFDPVLDAWTQLPPHPGPSRWAPSSFIIDGVVYLFNGTAWFNATGNVYQSEAYKFDLDALISSSSTPKRNSSFTLYPNPASSLVRLDLVPEEYDMIRVYSATNLLLYTSFQKDGLIDVSVLPGGLYRVEAFGKHSIKTSWLVKD